MTKSTIPTLEIEHVLSAIRPWLVRGDQLKISKQLRIDRGHVCNILNGKATPNFDVINTAADIALERATKLQSKKLRLLQLQNPSSI
jgi:hypothetical protein